jgi:predicted DNA-binding WGR domain protein
MNVLYLTRIDAARNMHRFYRVDVQPTLFVEFALVREWGRIGRPGQVRSTPFPTPAEAAAAAARHRRAKERRGYQQPSAARIPYHGNVRSVLAELGMAIRQRRTNQRSTSCRPCLSARAVHGMLPP